MIKILRTDEIDAGQWQQLIDKSSTASFFQTRDCYEFYCKLSFLEPFLYGVSENEKLVGLVCGYIMADGGILKRYFSRRAIVPGGLLLDKDISDMALNGLMNGIKNELRKKAIYIEIRNFNDYSSYRLVIENSGFVYQPHLNIHVQTPDVETVFNELSSTKRRQLRQTQHVGVVCVESSDLQDIKAFYSILSRLHKNKIKTPLFPISFFEELVNNSFAKLFVVKKDNEVLGGIVCVMHSNKTVYEWFVCGEELPKTNIYPSILATWAGIQYAASAGFERFDFMGAGKPGKDYGVRDFKARFGGKLVEHGRFLYICNGFLYSIGKAVINVYKKL